MNHGNTIVTELEGYLQREHLTISKFAVQSGLHSGTLSNIINGQRPISMKQLDQMTEAMGLKKGHYYDQYITDFIINGSADWRRTGPLLQQCAELGDLEAIRRVVNNILDNLTYLPMLFDAAESLFDQGLYSAASVIYKGVAEGERFQHSERLALCQYRLFHMQLGENQDTNLQAANQFEPYVERLDEADQLDAIKQLADVHTSLQRWDKAEEWGKILGKKGRVQYEYYHNKRVEQKQLSKPLIYYTLYSYLTLSNVYYETGKHEKALHYASLYAEVNWARTPYSEDERVVLEQFKEWSTANILLYRLMSGQVEALPEYVQYIKSRENEIAHALFNIVRAANLYRFNVDNILERFHEHMAYGEQFSRFGRYKSPQITQERRIRFFAELAVYHLQMERFDQGFDYLSQSFEASVRTQSKDNMMRCVGLFERYRSLASSEQKEKFFADNFLSYDFWYWGIK
ncbi:helix-turn-helix domain-containing protein [Paenibacillus tepidiphilus]|uniref:helix-turn-helix domain-containing protein n=1 Tax=Paenibacillus tepidiphilus TaxID=2608683 RepID=UPI001238D98F|nr:helix-turn-helix transcriptional regulator [Paenibacillus tepidiphilus]